MRTELLRSPTCETTKQGAWWPIFDVGAPTPTTAAFSCPMCGHWNYLNLHTIAADGMVNPYVMCDRDGCEMQGLVQLMGWDPAEPPQGV